MTWYGWAEIALTFALVAIVAFPLGAYLAKIASGEPVFLTPVLGPVEHGFYRLAGIDPKKGMGWQTYVFAVLMISVLHFAFLYALLRLQNFLPAFLNPAGMGAMPARTSFNTAVSFLSNTNWQNYSGEQAVAYGVQMLGLTVHNFLSPAVGIAAAFAVARAFGVQRVKEFGNFWADLTRITLYVLLPIVVVMTLVFMSQGLPQTLANYAHVTTLEGAQQTIALGPVAFQEAIKELGTNGGGFFNANSAHPFENPTQLTNLIEMVGLVSISFALAIAFGHIIGDKKQGRVLFFTMGLILLVGVVCAYVAEAHGNPLLSAIGVDPSQGNMEGKEMRFGAPLSSLFGTFATGTSTGAVNSMHDSWMPLGGIVPIFLMELGEVSPGGVGSGLYGILAYCVIAMFVAGLMVGRTPEYLGKKLGAKEVKLAMLAFLILTLSILAGTAYSIVTASGLGSLSNAGPHGLSEMLYAWSSATENNGSAFAGLSGDTNLLDYGLGIAMILGRFGFWIPVMAIAGSLGPKVKLAPSAGTFPTHGLLFMCLLGGVIVIMGGLQFLPALSLGPIAEHFTMLAGKTY
jgi:K+-transporting ATPase ATPase A chain